MKIQEFTDRLRNYVEENWPLRINHKIVHLGIIIKCDETNLIKENYLGWLEIFNGCLMLLFYQPIRGIYAIIVVDTEVLDGFVQEAHRYSLKGQVLFMSLET